MKNASLLIHPEELSRKWIDRMAKHGVPTLGLHPVGGKTADESLRRLVDEQVNDPEFRALLDYAHEKGLNIEYEIHAARYLLPASEFEKHPEWFRMKEDGERTPDFNLCASNEEALDYFAEQAAALAKKLYRNSDRYFLWLDDVKNSSCHCPACKNLTPSDQQEIILNRMVQRMRRDNPNATLAYLAYVDRIEPPTNVKPAEGIFLEYAPIERNFHAPLDGSTQSKPLEALLSLFDVKSAKVLDYWYDNSLFSKWTKPPKPFAVDEPVLEADFAFYRSLGFEDIGCFACYLGEDYEELHGDVDISAFGRVYHNA